MILSQIENYDPLPPRKLHEAIDPRLEAICVRALFKNPADRYQTASEMAESLRFYLAGRSIPGSDFSTIFPSASRAPVLPAETRPDASPAARWSGWLAPMRSQMRSGDWHTSRWGRKTRICLLMSRRSSMLGVSRPSG